MVTSWPRCSWSTCSPGPRSRSAVSMLPRCSLSLAERPVDAVPGAHDVVALRVQPRDQFVEVVEQAADVGLTPAHRLVELLGDVLQLRDTTTVEQQRQRAEDLFDLGVAVRAVQADGRAFGQPPGGSLRGRGQLDVLLTQQAGLAQPGDGVGGQLDVSVEGHRHLGVPRPGCQDDVGDPSDRHVVDPDTRVGHEVEHVGEADLHVVGGRCRRRLRPAAACRRRRARSNPTAPASRPPRPHRP
ncbi:hypothetical protein FHU35_13734 [Saccharopolyspora dendranthemae]|uniref:Uncharacterized protein n=1 Tax=Saccharopolyspora dendranthemae TaxID=1181886 RepID=A0A561U6L1_9PSEU|nr:hypothetical protein FHU35_13734 [Saccharopolyspora dendranthemae]